MEGCSAQVAWFVGEGILNEEANLIVSQEGNVAGKGENVLPTGRVVKARVNIGICPNGDTDVHPFVKGEGNARVGYEVSFVRVEGVSGRG